MATSQLKIGSTCPEFNLPATDGKNYNSDSFNTKMLMVVFGCNHCPYVQAYEDRIMKIINKYTSAGLSAVVINSNDDIKYPDDSFEEMKKRAEKRNFNFPYLRDETQDTAKAFGATHTPEIFLFNEGKLAYHGKVDDNWQDENAVKSHYLADAIEEIIAGKEISVPETFSIGCTIKWK